jgi:hypothetical protein
MWELSTVAGIICLSTLAVLLITLYVKIDARLKDGA